ASAYSLKRYDIAWNLGGDEAYQRLRDKAWQRGIRLASDMVPNHMGIDSHWIIEHPDWFIALPYSPFPSYSFSGEDLSPVQGVTIKIEDHYYDRTDAAVVFMRYDHNSGDTRFIYHGNDGTSMPWNDTAQLNYLIPTVREAVIQTILHVARKFPIIRFDAAMTLAKKHYQRLWFPQPGTGGAIPSRAEHGLTREAFDEAFPKEFWREVVDRVAQEAPDTLLLAEAFWLMEGYFVRTLGMHRVYNSAFMNMLRNEENSKYRLVIKNTLEFDPQILKRYVNFMNNPDEKTAVEQFGKGDKYFGICTLMATMPGLPMFGHGQIQGFAEKYGMEYYRPYWDEHPDLYLIQRHQQAIFPLLKRRDLFSGVRHFLLYDFYSGENRVNEDVFAFSNGNGNQFALVVYHNRFGSTQGWIHSSASYLNKQSGHLENRNIFEGLHLESGNHKFIIFRDSASGLEYIRASQEIQYRGMFFQLEAYECHVFMDFRVVNDDGFGQYAKLNAYLNGRGVPSIDQAIKELMLAPILNPLREISNVNEVKSIYQARMKVSDEKINAALVTSHGEKYLQFIESVRAYVQLATPTDPIVRE
ncbi:MAG: alpha-amylase family glycosyl hydrolase, partial [Anaerolineales bacterium]